MFVSRLLVRVRLSLWIVLRIVLLGIMSRRVFSVLCLMFLWLAVVFRVLR